VDTRDDVDNGDGGAGEKETLRLTLKVVRNCLETNPNRHSEVSNSQDGAMLTLVLD
jgi:hypothetical protein